MWRSTPLLGVECDWYALAYIGCHYVCRVGAGACRSSVGPPSQCIFSVVNTTTGGTASLLQSSRILLTRYCVGWVRSQAESVDGAVVLRYCRVLSCTLRRKRLVGLTKCCDYFPASRRIAVVKVTVQGTGVIHLIQYGTRRARYRCYTIGMRRCLPGVGPDCRVACAKWVRQWFRCLVVAVCCVSRVSVVPGVK